MSRSGFVYSRSSVAKQENAKYVRDKEDMCLAAWMAGEGKGHGGGKGTGPRS